LHPRPPQTPNARAIARAFLAAVLAFVVAAGAVPSGSALGAHGCSMPCCKRADGTPGDCEGGSCPVSHFGAAEAAPSKSADADHSQHTGGEASTHDGAHGAHHAEPVHKTSHAHSPSHTQHAEHAEDADGVEPSSQDAVEHSHHVGVSARDTSTSTPVVSAALSKPCPPDCGGLPTSSTQLRRGRDEAALPYKLRPRPPCGNALSCSASVVSKDSSVLRRQYPPRAPPKVSASRPV
jgi:hypothetical protein